MEWERNLAMDKWRPFSGRMLFIKGGTEDVGLDGSGIPGWRWLERLSLDAVLVVGLWAGCLNGWVPGEGRGIDLGILLLVVWLVYVGDRLLDVRRGPKGTDRHQFHARHATVLWTLWRVGFAAAVWISWQYLDHWKFVYGCLVAATVFLYWGILQRVRVRIWRFILKRLSVPLILVSGIGLMTEAWRSREALMALALLFVAAMLNLTLISLEENRFEEAGYFSLLSRFAAIFWGTLFVFSIGLSWTFLPVGVAGLYGSAAFSWVYVQVRKKGIPAVRIWTDAILADMAILMWIGMWMIG